MSRSPSILDAIDAWPASASGQSFGTSNHPSSSYSNRSLVTPATKDTSTSPSDESQRASSSRLDPLSKAADASAAPRTSSTQHESMAGPSFKSKSGKRRRQYREPIKFDQEDFKERSIDSLREEVRIWGGYRILSRNGMIRSLEKVRNDLLLKGYDWEKLSGSTYEVIVVDDGDGEHDDRTELAGEPQEADGVGRRIDRLVDESPLAQQEGSGPADDLSGDPQQEDSFIPDDFSGDTQQENLIPRDDSSGDTYERGPPSTKFTSRLADAVRSDEQLYKRILLMEPIAFEEILSLAQRRVLSQEEEDGTVVVNRSTDATTQSDPDTISLPPDHSDEKTKTSKEKTRLAAKRGGRAVREDIKAWLDLSGIVWYSSGENAVPASR